MHKNPKTALRSCGHYHRYLRCKHVPIDIPLQHGLDYLWKLRLLVNFDDGTRVSIRDDWRLHLVHKKGHMYDEWPPAVYYNDVELMQIHENCFHPVTEKLFGS